MIKSSIELGRFDEEKSYFTSSLVRGREFKLRNKDGYVDPLDVVDKRTKKSTILSFMRTSEFTRYLIICDPSFMPTSTIYLIRMDDHIVKVGRTFDIERRYDNKILAKIMRCEKVSNSLIAERKLIEEFSKTFKIAKGREFFYVDESNIEEAVSIFDIIADNYHTDFQKIDSKLVDIDNGGKNKNIWIHPNLIPPIIHKYISSDTDKINLLNTYRLLKKQFSHGSFDVVYDQEEKTNCFVWIYFGYIIIQRVGTNYFNASRLLNSIKKSDGKIDEAFKLSKILAAPRIKRLIEECKKRYPNEEILINYRSKSQPTLNGIYLRTDILNSFISILRPSHEIEMNNLLLKIGYEIYSNDFTEEATKIEIVKNKWHEFCLNYE